MLYKKAVIIFFSYKLLSSSLLKLIGQKNEAARVTEKLRSPLPDVNLKFTSKCHKALILAMFPTSPQRKPHDINSCTDYVHRLCGVHTIQVPV